MAKPKSSSGANLGFEEKLWQAADRLKMHSYGTVFDTITTKTFKDMKIPIPPESMIKSFDNKVSSIMNQVLHNLHESSNLDALLPKLMSGEIRVPNRGD